MKEVSKRSQPEKIKTVFDEVFGQSQLQCIGSLVKSVINRKLGAVFFTTIIRPTQFMHL